MEGQGKAVFDYLMDESTKSFLSSFILDNRHDLECTTPKFIIADVKREYATIQGVEGHKYTENNEQLIFMVADAWYSKEIVIIVTDSTKKNSFHVLKIARPQALAPVTMNDTATRFATQSAKLKNDMIQSIKRTKDAELPGATTAANAPAATSQAAVAGEAGPVPTTETGQVAQADAVKGAPST